MKELSELVDVVKKLRDPNGGCPWDLEQTHESLLRFLEEEAYEFIHAVSEKDDEQMKDELGDVLLQVLLHSVISEQRGSFNLEDVAKNLKDKMIRRHPHVFENPEGRTFSQEEIKKNWKDIKSDEKSGEKKDVLGKDILALQPMHSSVKIGKLSTDYNFDWDDASQVAYKVEEEWQELKEELMPQAPDQARLEDELGDLLFSVCQLSRHLKIDPNTALRKANLKFASRFNQMIQIVKDRKLDPKDMEQLELDHYWQEAKQILRDQ